MNLQALAICLGSARDKVAKWPLEQIENLKTQFYQEEYGDPIRNPSEYYQVEVEFLQEWVEKGVPVMQVSVIARSLSAVLEVQVCYFKDGRVEKEFPVYDMTSGLPALLRQENQA